MLHDGLMLNPEQIRFEQDGADFFNVTEEGRGKRVFAAKTDVDRFDVQSVEDALKEFVIWCYDKRLTPVRAWPLTSGPHPGTTPRAG